MVNSCGLKQLTVLLEVNHQILEQIWHQVWNQVWNQVRDQVYNQINAPVLSRTLDPIRGQIWLQINMQQCDV